MNSIAISDDEQQPHEKRRVDVIRWNEIGWDAKQSGQHTYHARSTDGRIIDEQAENKFMHVVYFLQFLFQQ